MKLSIILPVLNEAESIQRAVAQASGLQPQEIIVVDGGSTDRTVELATPLNCRVVTSARGRAKQQNAGAAVATGDVLLFLHADCWLDPSARSQIERAVHTQCVMGGVFEQRIDAREAIYRVLEWGNSLRVCCTRIAYGDQGFFIRREIFDRVGGFPDVRFLEDVLLARRLRDYGRLTLLPGPIHVSARRWKKHGLVRQTLRNWLLLTAEACGVHPDQLANFYAAR